MPCTYTRVLDEKASTPTSSNTGRATLESSANFLLGLTDPNAHSMVHVLQGDEEPANSEDSSPQTPSSLPDNNPIDYNFIYWGLGGFQPGEFSETLADTFTDYGIQFDLSCSGLSPSSADDVYSVCANKILLELDDFHAFITQDTLTQSTEYHLDNAMAHGMITPTALRTHIASYFRFTDVYLPTVHRPTFTLEKTPPALLLSLFLCGSLNSRAKGDEYRGVYNLAEEYIFAQLRVAMESTSLDHVATSKDIADILRAATLIHYLQWVVSSKSSRKRNWSVRLPALVSAVRRLGYTRLRHASLNSGAKVNWESFIEVETCIR